MIATFPASFAKLGYDPIKDLVPIGGIGVTPTLLVTASANPANDLKGLVAWSKSKPDGLTFSTAGYGLLQHLAVEEMGQRLKTKVVHVAYKGGAQASTDLITGRVDFGSFAAGSMLPLVNDGKLKGVAVIQAKRSALAPNVPTTVEQGLPGLDAGVQFLLFAPAATPKDVVAHAERGAAQDRRRSVARGALRQDRLRSDPDHVRRHGPGHAQDGRRLDAPDQATQHQARLTGQPCFVGHSSLIAALLPANVAQANDDFYAGKTVRIIIGTTTAGDYGLYAQLMAQHIGKHIPGKPTVIVQTMLGGGGLVALNHLAKIAPQDGTVLSLPHINIVQDGLLNPKVQFDPGKFQWIGRASERAAGGHRVEPVEGPIAGRREEARDHRRRVGREQPDRPQSAHSQRARRHQIQDRHRLQGHRRDQASRGSAAKSM